MHEASDESSTTRTSFLRYSVLLQVITLVVAIFKDSGVFGTLFCVVLLSSMAFYLFQFGNLKEFTLKFFSGEAKFVADSVIKIKEKIQEIEEVTQQSKIIYDDVTDLRAQLSKQVEEINASNDSVRPGRALHLGHT